MAVKRGYVLGYRTVSAGRLSQLRSLVQGQDYTENMFVMSHGRHLLQALVSQPSVSTVRQLPPHVAEQLQVIYIHDAS